MHRAMHDLSEYHEQYQIDSLSGTNLAAFQVVADSLYAFFGPKTALDIGCGGGPLIRGLQARGVQAWGIDGSPYAAQHMPDRILCHDLRTPLYPQALDMQVSVHPDLITCFDTAEHIEPECVQVFIKNISGFIKPDQWLVFGPAGPRQEGHHHVNLQHPCYWIKNLDSEGYELDPYQSEMLRCCIREDERHAHAWWVAENLMVFRSEGGW